MVEAGQAVQNSSEAATKIGQPAQPVATQLDKPAPHTEIKGRFNQYTSPYWALMLAALTAVRYGVSVLAKLYKWVPVKEIVNGAETGRMTAPSQGKQRLQPLLVGGLLYCVTLFYAGRTFGDYRRLFTKSLADEFDKKPEDIGTIEFCREFMRSTNTVVEEARNNFFKYNARRFGVTSFFLLALFKKPFTEIGPDRVADIAAVGNAGYLMTDTIWRKATSYEELSSFAALKLNQIDRIGERVTTNDLVNLYEHHIRKKYPERSLRNKMHLPEWQEIQFSFGRMADLMNETYKLVPVKEQANFDIDTFIYLIGHKLIDHDHPNRTLAYVEVANKYGIKAVKEMASKLGSGASLESVLQRYPVEMHMPKAGGVAAENSLNAAETPERPSNLRVMPTRVDTPENPASFAGKVENRADLRVMPPPASHQERVAVKEGQEMALPGAA